MKDQGSVIFWFRKGLRLHDNPALINALMLATASGKTLRCIYIFDPWYKENKQIGPHKYRFIIQSLHDLHEALYQFGSRLFVFRGNPRDILNKYFIKWKALFITWEKEYEPYSLERDEEIEKLAASMSIGVSSHDSHTLYKSGVILEQNGGKVPSNYRTFSAVLKKVDPPAKPVITLSMIPESCKVATDETISWECDIPSLRDLAGVDDEALGPIIFPGGETEALKRLEKELCLKEKEFTFPEPSPIELNPYINFGCVSPRVIYWRIKDKYKGVPPSKLPTSLLSLLTWREFYYCVASCTPNFDKMKNNILCRQIPWDHDIEKIQAWSQGKTGFPFIDAVMRQLKAEGWIHHLLRNAAACFLTRGDLWQSWEEGRSVFEEFLLENDWFLNCASWMRSSVSAFSHQYFRVFNPVGYGKKLDPEGKYIKKYLPLLKHYPPEYIYQPWEAPLGVQKKAGCIIGFDYPEPIVEHSFVSKENCEKMKNMFAEVRLAKKRKIGDEFDDGNVVDDDEDSDSY